MHANHLKTGQLQQLQLTPVRLVTTTGQTGAQHVHRTNTLTGQTGDLERSDRCTPEPRNGSKPPENLLLMVLEPHMVLKVVDVPKSYNVDVLCVHYPSHQTVTRGYEVLLYLTPPTFLTCKRIVSSCLVAKVEVVDGRKSYQVDILCVHYPSHQTVTCGYKVLFSLISLLSLLFRDLYHLGSLPP
jgi:hypothetical protein